MHKVKAVESKAASLILNASWWVIFSIFFADLLIFGSESYIPSIPFLAIMSKSAFISIALKAAAVSVDINGFPVPPAKSTNLPFSKCLIALRLMYGSATEGKFNAVWVLTGISFFSSWSCRANAFIIVDEAQNLSIHELKTIVTRVGEGTKLILTGDIEQIDNVYVNETSNGLAHAVENFKQYPISGHVTFTKGERSELATLASKVL